MAAEKICNIFKLYLGSGYKKQHSGNSSSKAYTIHLKVECRQAYIDALKLSPLNASYAYHVGDIVHIVIGSNTKIHVKVRLVQNTNDNRFIDEFYGDDKILLICCYKDSRGIVGE